jgi:uncharacterized protein
MPKRSWSASSSRVTPIAILSQVAVTILTHRQYIDEIALKFPNLKIICGHIGFPWTQEMIAVAWKHPNVFIDTSAYLPKYYPPVTFPLPFRSFVLLLLRLLLWLRFGHALTRGMVVKELIQFANTIGRKKVMFGTNFPQLSWKACVKSANQDIKLRDDAKAAFFGGNVANVLKLNDHNSFRGKL